MLNKEKIKKYLKKAVDEKYDEITIFRYSSILNKNIDNKSFNFDYKKSFHLSYPDIKYYGLDNCIKYELKSKRDILNIINKKTKVISFGDNTKAELKFFGSIGFDMDVEFEYPSENTPKGLFFIPKILIEKNKKNTIISFHTLLNKDINSILNDFEKLESKIICKKLKPKKNKAISRNSINKEQYKKTFNKYINDIKNHKYNKIVLSKIQKINLESDINYNHIFNQMDNSCTNFLFSLKNNEKIFGSSPEKLIYLDNNKLISEAIAGTYSKDKKIDQNELLLNEKELSEHNFVIKHIVKILDTLSLNTTISKSKILELKHLLHIQTPIECNIKENKHICEILHKLHPTPAVAGYPVKDVIDIINNNESYSRGWYRGCFGWYDNNGNGKFNVTIRCGLKKQNELILFSGGGLVKESNLDKEWDETEAKFQHLLSSII